MKKLLIKQRGWTSTMFLEMENNHIDTVQYELDYISRTGYWFGIKEFDME